MLIADLGKDAAVLKVALETAIRILDNDPDLAKPEHKVVKQQIDSLKKTAVNWSRIS